MRILCNRKKLQAVIKLVKAAAPRRSPKPILTNFKLEVTDRAILIATDLDISISHELECVEIHEPGQCLLPVSRFESIVRESKDDVLAIHATAESVEIRGENNSVKFPAAKCDEFPLVAPFDATAYYEVASGQFRDCLVRTSIAIDTESSRYALGGIKLEQAGGRLTSISTDGGRLAKTECPISTIAEPAAFHDGVIISDRVVKLLVRSLPTDHRPLAILVTDSQILLKTIGAGSLTICAKPLEGRFPRWRDVYPIRPHATIIQLPIPELRSALRNVALSTSEESRGVDVTFSTNRLKFTAESPGLGRSECEFPINYLGAPLTLTLDPRFILDFLKVVDDQTSFTCNIEGANYPIVCTTDNDFGYVMMPLRKKGA